MVEKKTITLCLDKIVFAKVLLLKFDDRGCSFRKRKSKGEFWQSSRRSVVSILEAREPAVQAGDSARLLLCGYSYGSVIAAGAVALRSEPRLKKRREF